MLFRDLSLRNILVTAGGTVKVTDFGIARIMEQGKVHTSEIRGTPVYLSPEAIDSCVLDARADLFSLGAVLYDLLAGMPPCGNHEMRGAIFARTLYGKFEPLPRDTPADLTTLITGLLRTDREARRPQTAAEALALLRGNGQPVASQAELAALVGPAKARRDQGLADDRPANVLPPGYVLAPRDERRHPARASGREGCPALPAHVGESNPRALPERATTSEVEVLPARAAANADAALPGEGSVQANPLRDLVAYFGADRMAKLIDDLPANPAPDLLIELESDGTPELAAEHAGDAVPEHIDDRPPAALAGHAPAPDPAADAQLDRVGEDAGGGMLRRRSRLVRRFLGRRTGLTVAIGACILVLGSLLDDGFRREQTAAELQQRPGASLPAAEPVPAPPVAITPAPAHRSPHRALGSTDGPRHDPIETQHRRPRPPAHRRDYVPPESKWPSWVQR